jgi:hypothetical protein
MPDAALPTLGTVLSVLRPLGAPPLGNPADLRTHAARLRTIADGLAAPQTLLAAAARNDGGEGPAADDTRSTLTHERAMLDRRVHGIRELAAWLDAQAAALESGQHAWRTALQRRVLGLPGALVNQAVGHLGWRLP